MTGPVGTLPCVREWSAALAAALDRVAGHLDVVARSVAEGRSDARGREWVDRLALLRRDVLRDADDAHALGRSVDRLAAEPDPPVPPGDPDPVGPRLGDTAAGRVDDRRGVTIPQLGDHPGG